MPTVVTTMSSTAVRLSTAKFASIEVAGGHPLVQREVQAVRAEVARERAPDDDHGDGPGDDDGRHGDDPGARAEAAPDERRQPEAGDGQGEHEGDEELHRHRRLFPHLGVLVHERRAAVADEYTQMRE